MLHAARTTSRSCARLSANYVAYSCSKSATNNGVGPLLIDSRSKSLIERPRTITTSPISRQPLSEAVSRKEDPNEALEEEEAVIEEEDGAVSAEGYSSLQKPRELSEHAVISAFDLFSIGGEYNLSRVKNFHW